MDDRIDHAALRNANSAAGTPANTMHVHGRWSADRISALFLVALLPSLIVVLIADLADTALTAAIAIVVTLAWQILFARVRGSLVGWDGVVTAISFSLLLPAGLPLWQTILSLSFGVVVGEQIFGGRGRAFLSPAAVALAFLFFSFPASVAEATTELNIWAVLLGALLLLILELISLRVVIAAVVGLFAAGWVGIGVDLQAVNWAPIVFGLVFLGCDPSSSATTGPGRLAYGFLLGALIVIFGGDLASVVFAVMLASVFAPLIDQAVLLIVRQRRRSERRRLFG